MTDFKLPRHARGERPAFFPGEPAADRLLGMVMTLATELAVVRERLDTIERITAARGMDLAAEVDCYEPPIAVREAREAWRQAFLDRLLKMLGDEVAPFRPQAVPAAGPPPGPT
jgi:hypothetical protein